MEIANLGEYLEQNHTKTEAIKIVVQYADGKVLKGFTHSFFPNKPVLLVFPLSDQLADKATEVHVKDLKVLFFVRDFERNPTYNEDKRFYEDNRPVDRKVEVIFKDGEVLAGTTVGYDPFHPGFFLCSVDPQSNSLRVFAVSSAARKVRHLENIRRI